MSNQKTAFSVLELKTKGKKNAIYQDFDFDGFADWLNAYPKENRVFSQKANRFTSLDLLKKVKLSIVESRTTIYFGMMSTGTIRKGKTVKDVEDLKGGKQKHAEGSEAPNSYFLLSFHTPGEIDVIVYNVTGGITPTDVRNYLDAYIRTYYTAIGQEKPFETKESAFSAHLDLKTGHVTQPTTAALAPKSVLTVDPSLKEAKRLLTGGYALHRLFQEKNPAVKAVLFSQYDIRNAVLECIRFGNGGLLGRDMPMAEEPNGTDPLLSTGYGWSTQLYDSADTMSIDKDPKRRSAQDHITRMVRFSKREMEIIRLSCQEFSNKQIADRLNISTRTVEQHRKRMMERIGAKNFIGTIMFVLKHQLLCIEDL